MRQRFILLTWNIRKILIVKILIVQKLGAKILIVKILIVEKLVAKILIVKILIATTTLTKF